MHLNFETMVNYSDDVVERASVFVPRVGSIVDGMRTALRHERPDGGSRSSE